MIKKDGSIELLEINPRPSGSTASYLPFGINLYYCLIQEYLMKEKTNIPRLFSGRKSLVFNKMVSRQI